ncbi:hypothetical protein GCM10027084_00670 [Pseudoxanthomonas sangjuensis]|uniref:DUF3293 domain-containing protein n=1 Tax=Pseudoxanthomonas sangjuensis TaxID=1503750 RepID=UPI0013912F85|nr:DUF3293 domain-containing protein [Pseudoxanthomonas sangjuensis]KAF1713318.1 hypothetical protein CSC71_08320 [Pseudoxanthomonas sangjuensis]
MGEDSVPGLERVDPGRIAALAGEYLLAHYFVALGKREWLFQVGQTADDVERQLVADRYLFITAWNPASRSVDAARNLAAGERLLARLSGAGYAAYPALGCDADGGGVERGHLALDVPVDRADALAREFGQLGTLCWRHGEPVRLRMLAPRPPGFPEHPYTDWVG